MKKTKGQIALIAACAAFAALFLVLPLIFVITQALKDGIAAYMESIVDEYTLKALSLTVRTTIVAVVFNTLFGVIAAWTVTKYDFRGKKALATIIDIPLSVSPVIAGLIYILTFGRTSPIYPFLMEHNLTIVYAVPGIMLATIFTTLPYVSREIIPVLSNQGTHEEEAALLLGAGGFTVFRKVTFPHIKWPLIYGVVLCTARAMGEFGAVSILSGHLRGKTNTLPLHIEILYNEFNYTQAFAVSSILVFLAIIILILRSVIEHKGKKAGI
ncbi:MAG: sulfate ABC transporter permease subunit CysW [Clostridia bacterium]|nr:sulfate ABC transporter permease subunit CysW [Clostridia bacterium]